MAAPFRLILNSSTTTMTTGQVSMTLTMEMVLDLRQWMMNKMFSLLHLVNHAASNLNLWNTRNALKGLTSGNSRKISGRVSISQCLQRSLMATRITWLVSSAARLILSLKLPLQDVDETEEPVLTEASEGRSFSSVISNLQKTYPRDKMEEISTSFCFICLLHLANEQGLKLQNETATDNDEADTKIGDIWNLKVKCSPILWYMF